MSSDPIWGRPEPGERRSALSRARIAEAALALADEHGFGAVSMRRVAAELAVGTMSLYHYLRTKDELLALMDDAIMGEVLIAEDEFPSDWRAALTELAERSRAVWTRHPWTLTDLIGGRFGPNGMMHFEQSLRAVGGLGLTPPEQLELITLVDDYTVGYCLRERDFSLEARDDTEWASVEDFAAYMRARLDSGDYPQLTAFVGSGDAMEVWRRVGEETFDPGRFRRGLDRLLDGVALHLERRREGATQG